MMNTNDSIEVLMALKNWILRVAGEKGAATPEEVKVLPEVAALVLNYKSLFSFVRNS